MLDNLRAKKIAILGLGANNRHLAQFFDNEKIAYTAFDGWADPDELTDKLTGFEVVFRTPGLPYQSKLIQTLLSRGVDVSSQTKLFFELCPAPIIGVTGTKGKGTTSSLITAILTAGSKQVRLAGNIGRDPFEFLAEIKKDDWVVLELSSFQLQDLHKSPHIAVVLNITTDHVNPDLKMGTHYSHDEYVRAKSSIVEFQKSRDYAVLHPGLPDWFRALGEGKKIIIDPESVSGMETKLLGQHNRENIAPAVETGKLVGISEDVIRQAVANFEPLPHRLQYLLGNDGITYVNDSFSTNEDSTMAAIRAFDKPIVLILGGSDKGHSYIQLAEAVNNSKNVKGLILIGDVADRIEQAMRGFSGKIIKGARTMPEIVSMARSLAEKGDVILLSPAAASFGLFKDYKQRGTLFMNEASK